MPPKLTKIGSKSSNDIVRREWPDVEKKLILDYLLETIQSGKAVEKPTASIYYSRLKEKITRLDDATPGQIKNVVKNLKKSYDTIIAWRNQTGEGIEDKVYVKDHILKKCPLFDVLDEIYGTRASVVPPFIAELGDVDQIDEEVELLDPLEKSLDNGDQENDSSLVDNLTSQEQNEEAEGIGSPVTPSSSDKKFKTRNELVERKRKAPITTSMGLMASACKQRSDLAARRLEFEKDSLDRKEKLDSQSLDLKREDLQLKKEIELEKLAIEREKVTKSHEVELKKLSLEEQKLKNEELKLKLELVKLGHALE